MDREATRKLDLAVILPRFPASRAKIRRLYLQDRHFRSACHDLALAIEFLSKLSTADGEPPQALVDEYTMLEAELHREISEILSRAEGA
jgi:hypothetical protein